ETAAMPTEAVPTTVYAGEGASQSEKIQYIRDAYNRIVANLGACRQDGGNYYDGNGMLVKKAVSNGNTVIDSAMRSNGYAAYSLEYYYDDQYPSPYPIFIFAVIDGKEYRYYFNNGNFIRRVGPEGSVNDSPEMNSFITTLRDEGYSDR
ncbi:MAG: hypothetical protein LIP16_13295, partial [Clostridium sp.]|nr:hypothetical protein [Clostridium sp.]